MSRPARQAALLRGVNVGRAKRIAMADLRRVVEGLGFGDVTTILNSGNVVYTSPALQADEAGAALERALNTALGLSSRVFAIEAEDFRAVLRDNPFDRQAKDAPSRALVALLAGDADRSRLSDVANGGWGEEAFALGRRAAYLWCPNGQAASPLAAAFVAAAGSAQTTRNWATMTRIAALL